MNGIKIGDGTTRRRVFRKFRFYANLRNTFRLGSQPAVGDLCLAPCWPLSISVSAPVKFSRFILVPDFTAARVFRLCIAVENLRHSPQSRVNCGGILLRA